MVGILIIAKADESSLWKGEWGGKGKHGENIVEAAFPAPARLPPSQFWTDTCGA